MELVDSSTAELKSADTPKNDEPIKEQYKASDSTRPLRNFKRTIAND